MTVYLPILKVYFTSIIPNKFLNVFLNISLEHHAICEKFVKFLTSSTAIPNNKYKNFYLQQ